MIDHFISWLYTRKIWGPRCSDFEPDCVVCKQWFVHDGIFNEREGVHSTDTLTKEH